MDDKKRQRFALAVYLFIASLSLLLAIYAINYTHDSTQSILLNLSTELAGVVIIFFLVNRLFLSDSWDTSDRLENLLNRLEKKTHLLKGEEDNTTVEKLFSGSSKIDLLGYSYINVMRNRQNFIIQLLRDGVQIRLVIVDPEKTAGTLSRENMDVDDLRRDVNVTLSIVANISEEAKKYKGKIEVRLINWLPSCGLIITDPDSLKGKTWVSIYPIYPSVPKSEIPHFILTHSEDEYWSKAYSNHFNRLWSKAYPPSSQYQPLTGNNK